MSVVASTAGSPAPSSDSYFGVRVHERVADRSRQNGVHIRSVALAAGRATPPPTPELRRRAGGLGHAQRAAD